MIIDYGDDMELNLDYQIEQVRYFYSYMFRTLSSV